MFPDIIISYRLVQRIGNDSDKFRRYTRAVMSLAETGMGFIAQCEELSAHMRTLLDPQTDGEQKYAAAVEFEKAFTEAENRLKRAGWNMPEAALYYYLSDRDGRLSDFAKARMRRNGIDIPGSETTLRSIIERD